MDRDRTAPPPAAGAHSLASLLTRVAAGDEVAFAALYDATASRVFGLALTLLGDGTQAELVTEDTYRQVWREAALRDVGCRALPWILAMAHEKATSRARQTLPGSRRRGVSLSASVSGRGQGGSLGEEQPPSAARRVRQAVERLAPTQREHLALAYFGGHTCPEVAAPTGTSQEAASSSIRDGLLRLRSLMNGEE